MKMHKYFVEFLVKKKTFVVPINVATDSILTVRTRFEASAYNYEEITYIWKA